MAVKHTKVATVADDGTSEVGTNEWNDDHTIDNNTITDDMVVAHTTTKITVPTTKLSGTVTNTQLAGSIANTKLATDPLARANHTGSQAQSTITDLTSDLALKSPLASPTFTGTVTTAAVDIAGNNIDNVQKVIHDLTTLTGVTGGIRTIDFNGDQLQQWNLSGSSAISFATSSNKATGVSQTIRLVNDGSAQDITLSSSWKIVGAVPTSIAASKTAILTLTCFGTAETDIVAAYAVEE